MNKYHQLTREERYRITCLMGMGLSQAEVAQRMGRSPSTISRELRRNRTTHDGHYRAEKAQKYSMARRRRARRRSWFSAEQIAHVEALLRKKWGPEQVSASLKIQGVCSISHETIYRHVLRDKRAVGRL